jgi:hypothetical protein
MVRITHPEGHQLPFSESYVSCLKSEFSARPFTTGIWLASLSTDKLEELRAYSKAILEEEQAEHAIHVLDDIAQLAILIASIEGGFQIENSPEDVFNTIGGILLSSTIELMSRKKLIEFDHPLSALPSIELSIRITEQGLKQFGNEKDKYFLAIFKLGQIKQ